MDNRIKGNFLLNFNYKVDSADSDTMTMVDNFVWRKVSPAAAKVLVRETDIDVYVLFEDGTESLIDQDTYDNVDFESTGDTYAIEVGHVELSIAAPKLEETVTITIEQ